MNKLIIPILLLCWQASGQVGTLGAGSFGALRGVSSTSTALNPTNLPGASPVAWFVAGDYYTNGSVPTLPNRWTANASWALTNSTGFDTNYPILISGMNGFQGLSIDGDKNQSLSSVNYTQTSPYEVVLALQSKKFGTTSWNTIMDGQSANRPWFGGGPTDDGELQMSRGAYLVSTGTRPGDRYFVLDVIFNGLNSRMFTNNVLIASGNASDNPSSGVTLGRFYTRNSPTYSCSNVFLEIAAYSQTNSTENRSNLFWYLTNKYAITP